MNEEWKTLPYALNYDISNYGNVRQNKKNKLLKPYINKQNGYIFRVVRYGKSVVSKQKPTLKETIDYKEKWLKEHRKENNNE